MKTDNERRTIVEYALLVVLALIIGFFVGDTVGNSNCNGPIDQVIATPPPPGS